MSEQEKTWLEAGTLVRIIREAVILNGGFTDDTNFSQMGDEILTLTRMSIPCVARERLDLCEFIGMHNGQIKQVMLWRHEFEIIERISK